MKEGALEQQAGYKREKRIDIGAGVFPGDEMAVGRDKSTVWLGVESAPFTGSGELSGYQDVGF